MPSLRAFGRRWQVGTDDFVFPGILDCSVKTCWLLGALVVLVQSEDHSCSNGDQLRLYLYGMISALLIIIVADITAIRCSMKGCIMDSDARKLVVPLIYCRLFLEALDTGWNILGSIWAFGESFNCFEAETPGTFKFIRRFIICNWISLVILGLFFAFFYDPLGGEESTEEVLQTVKEEFWENRFRRYCCYVGFPRKSDTVRDGFKEVGKVFAFILKDTNLISSDVTAGLFALYKREQSKLLSLAVFSKSEDKLTFLSRCTSTQLVNSMEQPAEGKSEQNMDKVLEVDHYFKFVNGSNGWRGFLINNRKERAICRLWNSIVCCGCWGNPYTTQIQGDNCCFCSMSALKETITDIQEEDVIYVSFKNDYYEVPFYIILDHPTKSYVVAMRGTFTGFDIITDLTAWPVPMNTPEVPSSYTVHHGMLLAAKCVQAKLKKLGILQRLKTKYPQYKLVLVGQSLGGGTATILGLMLRAEFPHLHVFAYNPPGGLLSLDAAEESESFTTSVVYGTDALARLSLPSLDVFRKRVIDTIFDCRTPKYKLLLGAMGGLFGLKTRIEFASDLDNKGMENTAYMPTSASGEDETEHAQANRAPNNVGPIMYLPGKIIYITQNPEWSRQEITDSGKEIPKFRIRWANRREFLEIIVSPRMYADHWHFQMLDALEEYKNPKKSLNTSSGTTNVEDIV